jgi:hypothetical protein
MGGGDAHASLESRYSALNLISGVALCVDFALMFYFFAGHLKYPKWFTAINYALAAGFAGVASIIPGAC